MAPLSNGNTDSSLQPGTFYVCRRVRFRTLRNSLRLNEQAKILDTPSDFQVLNDLLRLNVTNIICDHYDLSSK
jgi:hypothetical protein